ncbi:hypothetical protein ACX80N_12370 [Arthrobacter sp. MDT2-16]
MDDPFSADWSKELVVMLLERDITPLPLYVEDGERTKFKMTLDGSARGFGWEAMQRCSYWRDVWALSGSEDSGGDYGPHSVDVLLDAFGSVWISYGKFLTLEHLSKGEVDGWRLSLENGCYIEYPDVSPEDRGMFFLGQKPRPAVHTWESGDRLRSAVGVPVAAALQAATSQQSGWIRGLGWWRTQH